MAKNKYNKSIRVTIALPRAVREALRVSSANRGVCTSALLKDLIRAFLREEKITKDLPLLKKAQKIAEKGVPEEPKEPTT